MMLKTGTPSVEATHSNPLIEIEPRLGGHPQRGTAIIESSGIEAHCFVFTALGYINALEFLTEAGFVGKRHLFIIPSTEISAQQIRRLAKSHDWTRVHLVWPGDRPGVLAKSISSLRLLKISLWFRLALSRMTPDDHVVVSHLDNPYSRLISQHRIKQFAPVVVVDDGLSTLLCHKEMAKWGELPLGRVKPSMRARLERALLSRSAVPARAVRFFSMFSLEPCDGVASIGKNRLVTLRQMIRSQQTTEHVYFIGQPWLRAGRSDEREYYSAVERIREHYRQQGLEFIYIPHRNENRAEVAKRFRTLETELPLELFLLEASCLPQVLAGFFSTCLLTGFYVFGSKMRYEFFWGFPGALSPESWDPCGVTDFVMRETSGAKFVSINRTLGGST